MTNTQNYNLTIAEGTDTVNLLTQCYPNFETIDEAMKANKDAAISTSVETRTGTNHAIIRTNPDAAVFRFVATSNYVAGDTFTVDTQVVTATSVDGKSLASGAFVINQNVLCILVGTVLTVLVGGGSADLAEDSKKLGGELPAYYAEASRVTAVENDLALNYYDKEDIDNMHTYTSDEKVIGTWINGKPLYRKTFAYPSVNAGTPIPFDTNTSHVPVDVSAISFRRGDGYIIINNHSSASNYNYLSIWHEDSGVRGNYFLYLSNDNVGATDVTFTVDYYKTTD